MTGSEAKPITSDVKCKRAVKENAEITFKIILVLGFISLFNSSQSALLGTIGDIALYLISAVALFYLAAFNGGASFSTVQRALVLYMLLGGFVSLCMLEVSFSYVIRLFIIVFLGSLIRRLDYGFVMNYLRKCAVLMLLISLVDVFMFLLNRQMIFGNSNSIGLLGSLALLIILLSPEKKYKITLTVLCLCVIILSETRTAILFFAVLWFMRLCTKKLKNAQSVRNIFLLFALGCAVVIYFYINLSNFAFFEKLNTFVYSVTGKSLYSGRQVLWSGIFKNFKREYIFFGYGMGSDLSGLTGQELSAHNQFIQLLCQGGLLGLLSLLYALYYISVRTFRRGRKNSWVIVPAVIIYNMFEVFLIQNHFSVGLFIWIILFANMYYNNSSKNVPNKNQGAADNGK